MAIKAGDKIPSVILKQLTAEGMQDLSIDTVFKGKKVLMFAVPGAFTPTCSSKHLPSYTKMSDALKARDIDIACLAVNDPFVMSAWMRQHGAENAMTTLADGNAAFTKALGMEMDGTAYGLGIRSQRFALYAEDGVVKLVAVEKPGAYEVSGAEAMSASINALKQAA
jgi:peroxiredoxin